jgi:hypothetical protein
LFAVKEMPRGLVTPRASEVRMPGTQSVTVAVVIAAVAASAPFAASASTAPIHACDRLAAAALDRNRVSEGVDQSDMDSAAALAACRAAVDTDPDNVRFLF